MSTQELLARLARLHSSDRAWLLGELPPALRRELVTALGDEAIDAGPTPLEPATAVAGWESLEPQRAADVLETEPVWLVSAATRGTEARWRERLLQSMAPRRRHEIEIADRAGRPLTARAAQLVLEGCRERLSNVGAVTGAAPKHGFAALLDQMKSRFT